MTSHAFVTGAARDEGGMHQRRPLLLRIKRSCAATAAILGPMLICVIVSTDRAYGLDPDTLTLSAEEHHRAANSWTVGLRTTMGDEYDVVVGLVDGYAGSVRIRHGRRTEIFDSVGSE